MIDLSRVNNPAARRIVEVPALRIVAEADWQAVEAIMAARGGPRAPYPRHPRYLLSGLCRCGACGGSYTVAAPNRLGCSTRREKGICDNRRMISIRLLETRMIEALQQHLLHEDLIAGIVREYAAERRRLKSTAAQHARARDRRLGEVQRELDRLIDRYAKGSGAMEDVVARMDALGAEKAALKAAPAAAPDRLELHPGAAEAYRAMVKDLRAVLNEAGDHRDAVIGQVRRLIDKVVIYPKGDVRDLELVGTLAAILGGEAEVRTGMKRLVAGAGFVRPHTIPTVTISLRSTPSPER